MATTDERVGEAADERRRAPSYARMCLKCGGMTHTTRQCAFYKTQWCRHAQRPGGCKNWRCRYVHDMSEMRPTTQEWCVKFVFENGEGKLYGCGSPQHSYSGCPQRAAAQERGTEEDTSYQRLPIADFAALVLTNSAE